MFLSEARDDFTDTWAHIRLQKSLLRRLKSSEKSHGQQFGPNIEPNSEKCDFEPKVDLGIVLHMNIISFLVHKARSAALTN